MKECEDCAILKGREEIINTLKEELKEKDMEISKLQEQLNSWYQEDDD